MTTHYVLLTSYYLLLTTYYSLLTTDYSLLTTYLLLLTTYYWLLTTYYSLLATYYLLLTTDYWLLTTDYLLCTIHYLLLTVYYWLLTTYYLLLTTHFTEGSYSKGRSRRRETTRPAAQEDKVLPHTSAYFRLHRGSCWWRGRHQSILLQALEAGDHLPRHAPTPPRRAPYLSPQPLPSIPAPVSSLFARSRPLHAPFLPFAPFSAAPSSATPSIPTPCRPLRGTPPTPQDLSDALGSPPPTAGQDSGATSSELSSVSRSYIKLRCHYSPCFSVVQLQFVLIAI